MKQCRECGAQLIGRAITGKQREIALRNIDYFSRLLAEEGHVIPVDQERKMRRIIYESQLALDGEYPFEEALCEACRGR